MCVHACVGAMLYNFGAPMCSFIVSYSCMLLCTYYICLAESRVHFAAELRFAAINNDCSVISDKLNHSNDDFPNC